MYVVRGGKTRKIKVPTKPVFSAVTNFNDDPDGRCKREKRRPESKGVPESFSSYNIEVEPEGMGEHGKRGGIRAELSCISLVKYLSLVSSLSPLFPFLII